MRRFRPLSAVLFAVVVSALVGGVFGPSAARDRRESCRALQNILGGAERDRIELRRQGRFGSPRVQRDSRDARHARSAFELLRPARIRADARAAGRALLRPRHHHLGRRTATSPPRASSRDRPPTRTGIRRGDIISKIGDRSDEGVDSRSRRRPSCAGPRARPSRSRSRGTATRNRFRWRSRATRSTSPPCRRIS